MDNVNLKIQNLLYEEEKKGAKKVNNVSLIVITGSLILGIIVILNDNFILITDIKKNANFSNFIGLLLFYIYAIIYYFILKKNLYRPFQKYITLGVFVSILTYVIIDYSRYNGLAHSVRTAVLIFYLIIIGFSGFYQKPAVALFTAILTSVQYSILFFYVYIYTNIPKTKNEDFHVYSISLDSYFTWTCGFILLGFIVYSIAKHWNNLIARSLISETQSEALKLANEAITNANQQKTNFIINVAHETKTPLTLIDNYLKEYIKKYGTKPELEVMKDNINKLIHDFINIMDVEKLNKGMDILGSDKIINFSQLLYKKLELYH
ncbi:MAG: hypothetical protein MJB14_08635, partial [Spirochaetes bacterium]|nr:hypothetical protein [Spirochaetota bacterium]